MGFSSVISTFLTTFLFAASPSTASVLTPPPCRSAAEVARSLQESTPQEVPFDFTAKLTYLRTRHATVIAVEDESGATVLACNIVDAIKLKPGDRVHVQGRVRLFDNHKRRAETSSITCLAHGSAPTPKPVTIADILQGKLDYRLVRTSGVLRDCCQSETNAKWAILVVGDGNSILYVSVPTIGEGITALKNLIGSTVALTGVILPGDFTSRRRIGRTLKLSDETWIEKTGGPAAQSAAPLSAIGPLSPAEIATLGQHVVTGRVLAIWANDNALLQSTDGNVHGLTVKGPLPNCGQWVEAIGFPESDLFHLNLTHAVCTPVKPEPFACENKLARNICVRDLIRDEHGLPRFPVSPHGELVTVSGEILTIANDANGFGRMFIRSDGVVFPVELSGMALETADATPLSSHVSITGIFILDTDSWRPNSAFPQIRGFRVVTRTPNDIQTIRLPPFWTGARLLAVIGALLGALVTIFVWNLTLRRKAEQRGKELAQASIARLSSELKVGERTHLAVELHDTLSQAITGACLEVNAAQEFIKSDIPSATRYLSLAAKTLASCRNELRNCLWDLRSRALEEPDLNVAIRRTLEPYVGEDVALSIRFNVARKSLPDNTVHALMRIVRELVLNAIRHGEAHTVAVAGCIDDNRLLFSVKDDGCGFDTANVPGSATGHFGLQGIRERIQDFDGSMSIESATGRCTKVVVSISLSETKNPA